MLFAVGDNPFNTSEQYPCINYDEVNCVRAQLLYDSPIASLGHAFRDRHSPRIIDRPVGYDCRGPRHTALSIVVAIFNGPAYHHGNEKVTNNGEYHESHSGVYKTWGTYSGKQDSLA